MAAEDPYGNGSFIVCCMDNGTKRTLSVANTLFEVVTSPISAKGTADYSSNDEDDDDDICWTFMLLYHFGFNLNSKLATSTFDLPGLMVTCFHISSTTAKEGVPKSITKMSDLGSAFFAAIVRVVAYTGKPLTPDVVVDETWHSDVESCKESKSFGHFAIGHTYVEYIHFPLIFVSFSLHTIDQCILLVTH
ncbi:hypothetical protein RJ641_007307 [Dillenia turbinata]|uniref:Uncharacterized protein n=1 Tax=Dillenia turbinata TaxID=194707 RepID=A0AAN8VDB8_9MAGN